LWCRKQKFERRVRGQARLGIMAKVICLSFSEKLRLETAVKVNYTIFADKRQVIERHGCMSFSLLLKYSVSMTSWQVRRGEPRFAPVQVDMLIMSAASHAPPRITLVLLHSSLHLHPNHTSLPHPLPIMPMVITWPPRTIISEPMCLTLEQNRNQ
jgi:hypothetical protein